MTEELPMPIPEDAQERLAELSDLFIEAKAKAKQAEAEVERLAAEIRKITDAYTLNVASGKSEFVPVPSRMASVRVTRASEPPPVIIVGRFLDIMPEDVVRRVIGPWLDSANIPDKYFNMDEWQSCVREELVTEHDLVACLGNPNRKKSVDSLTVVSGLAENPDEDD